jgi:hypothetical protein
MPMSGLVRHGGLTIGNGKKDKLHSKPTSLAITPEGQAGRHNRRLFAGWESFLDFCNQMLPY